MIRKIFLFLLLILSLEIYSRAQSTADFTNLYNQPVSLDSFKNTKIMVVLLPAQLDSGWYNSMLRFIGRDTGQIRVLCLMDSALTFPVADSLQALYDSLSTAGVVLTSGMLTPPSDTTDRWKALLYWMTGKSLGRNMEGGATGRKYFISEDGRLYAVLGTETSLDDPVTDFVVNTQVPTRNH
jgi:hypothetical protein